MTYNLTHVQNNDGTLETDTNTGNKTASDDESETIDGHLKDDTDNVDKTSEHNSVPTTKLVGHISGHDGTEECTSGEDGGNERCV